MQNTFSQSGNDSEWFLKKSFFKIGMWHSRPPRDPPLPFMANAILNFHVDYWHTSLSSSPCGELGIAGWKYPGWAGGHLSARCIDTIFIDAHCWAWNHEIFWDPIGICVDTDFEWHQCPLHSESFARRVPTESHLGQNRHTCVNP